MRRVRLYNLTLRIMFFSEVYIGKLKLEARHRVEQNQVRDHKIIEYAEQKLEEARQINSLSYLPIFDLDEDEDFNYKKSLDWKQMEYAEKEEYRNRHQFSLL